MVTPVNVNELEWLLRLSEYDEDKSRFLVQGFQDGFDLNYQGPVKCKDLSKNIPFNEVGDKFDLWNKIMKEVSHKRFAGPFNEVPFEYYIQSPVGLVPKAQGGYQADLSSVI